MYEDDDLIMAYIQARLDASSSELVDVPCQRPMTPALLLLLRSTAKDTKPILAAVRALDPEYSLTSDGNEVTVKYLDNKIKRDINRICADKPRRRIAQGTLAEQRDELCRNLSLRAPAAKPKKRKRK